MPMEISLSEEDKRRIEAGIREKYARVAITPEGLFKYPIGRAGLEALHYDPDILRTLPPKALDASDLQHPTVNPVTGKARQSENAVSFLWL